MNQHDKIRVAVLYGGRSGEHEVSLLSAANVIQYLDRERFNVIPVGIDRQGVWFLGDDILKNELTTSLKLTRAADRMLFNPECLAKKNAMVVTENSAQLFDVVFPAIHGTFCEDGTMQGLLELADLPYVGCGVLASAVGMDKDVAKRLVMNAGLNVAPYVAIKIGQWESNAEKYNTLINQKLTYPVFVKPANTGSSLGVEKVKSSAELFAAIQRAFQYDDKILVEQGIDAKEIELAVLESITPGADPIVSVVGEICPHHEFYSYAAKYLDENGAELLIPASISDDLKIQAQEFAQQVFSTLECEGMARVDLFLDRNTNKFYFNEINTIPGFTQISMYPKLMQATGISYSDLLTHLVTLAVDRHARKSKLCREYVAE